MRFHVGPPPENPEFDPAAGGWIKLKEPTPWLMQLAAVPIALIVGAMLVLAVRQLGELKDISLGSLLIILVLMFPVHELIHALLHPGNGCSHDTVLGVWPKKIIFYAHYDSAWSRSRFHAVLLGPFLVLSVVPLSVEAVLRTNLTWIAWLSILNGMASCGDIFACFLLFQVPRTAMLRNQGYYTWWQPTQMDRTT